MKKDPQEIIKTLKEIRYFQPSVIRNSILMILMQLLSFTGALVMIAYSVVTYYGSKNEVDLIHTSILPDADDCFFATCYLEAHPHGKKQKHVHHGSK